MTPKKGRSPGAAPRGEAYYRELRRRAADRSRRRREKTGEPPPGQNWHCGRCRRDVPLGMPCPGCGTTITAS